MEDAALPNEANAMGEVDYTVKSPGSWKEQRNDHFKKARYAPEVKEKILNRLKELIEAGEVKNAILRIMKSEGFTKADGKEIDMSWLDYFHYNNRIAKYPTRGEVAENHLKSKLSSEALDEVVEDAKQSAPSTIFAVSILNDETLSDSKKVRLLKVLWCEV
jgi:hypothetical protein